MVFTRFIIIFLSYNGSLYTKQATHALSHTRNTMTLLHKNTHTHTHHFINWWGANHQQFFGTAAPFVE